MSYKNNVLLKKSENSHLLLPCDCVLCYTLQIFVHGLHFHKENGEGKYDGKRCLMGDGLKSWQRALGGCASWHPRHLLCSQSWIHAQCSASMLDTSQQWWFILLLGSWEVRCFSSLLVSVSWPEISISETIGTLRKIKYAVINSFLLQLARVCSVTSN